MPAAYCKARVTAGCGWPSAVQTTRRYTIPWARKSGISLRKWIVFRAKAACAASPRAAASLPLKRPETAVAVKRSASLDCVFLNPWGSVVTPGSASFRPPMTARERTRSGLQWLVALPVLQIPLGSS